MYVSVTFDESMPYRTEGEVQPRPVRSVKLKLLNGESDRLKGHVRDSTVTGRPTGCPILPAQGRRETQRLDIDEFKRTADLTHSRVFPPWVSGAYPRPKLYDM